MNKLKAALICTGILLTLKSYSQTYAPLNPPLGTLPMQFNGGFAGEAKDHRFVGGFGFSGNRKIYSTTDYFASYDKFITKLRTGIGVTYNRYETASRSTFQGPISSNLQNLTIAISPKFSFKGKYTLAPFIDYTYTSYTFRDSSNYSWNNNTWRAGLLLNTSKFFIGATAHPSFNADRNYLNVSLQAGYTFQKLPTSHFSFTPQAAVMYNNITYNLIAYWNLMARYKKFIWSFNGTNIEYAGFGAGIQFDNLRLFANLNVRIAPPIYTNRLSTALTARYILKRAKTN
jgi:hypothetical protein